MREGYETYIHPAIYLYFLQKKPLKIGVFLLTVLVFCTLLTNTS